MESQGWCVPPLLRQLGEASHPGRPLALLWMPAHHPGYTLLGFRVLLPPNPLIKGVRRRCAPSFCIYTSTFAQGLRCCSLGSVEQLELFGVAHPSEAMPGVLNHCMRTRYECNGLNEA